MELHKNARTCPASRALLVQRVVGGGWTVAAASAAAGCSERTGWKWVGRYREEGEAGLADRRSVPRRIRRVGKTKRRLIVQLRRERRTCQQIASAVARSRATVARIVGAVGLSRLKVLDGPPLPVRRYQREVVGDLIHLDVKKLARITHVGHRITGDRTHRGRKPGWEFLHVCIDDASRLAYAQVLADERKETCTAFLGRAVRWFRSRGVTVRQVMTDNGGGYLSSSFAELCRSLDLKHIRTRPYTPRTNGKAERLIQTFLREWAYPIVYPHSRHRTRLLPSYLHFYNHHRSHSALGGHPPISRLDLNNVLRNDI